jgi:hypothetical protein
MRTDRFAFGGVSYAGVISQGEKDYRAVLSRPTALADLRRHWIEDWHSTSKFLHVPSLFWAVWVRRHDFDFCRVPVEKYVITPLYFFTG